MCDTEAERWQWVQHHLCPQPMKVYFLPTHRDATQA